MIMLGLICHEPHFYIIREQLPDYNKKNRERDQKNLLEEAGEIFTEVPQTPTDFAFAVRFAYVKIPVLREYLGYEFGGLKVPFEYDFEKVIDDFVFLCFFVGNDFLPHLPSLEIREGAIDLIMFLYKDILPSLEGYLTENGKVNFERVEVLFSRLAKVEGEQFVKKKEFEDRFKSQQNRRGRDQSRGPPPRDRSVSNNRPEFDQNRTEVLEQEYAQLKAAIDLTPEEKEKKM